MNNLIISKKCKKPGIAVFFIVLFIAVGAITLLTNTGKPFAASDAEETMYYLSTVGLPILCLAGAAFMLACISRYSKSYIKVYDDHIEGVGVNNGFMGKLGNTASAFNYRNSDRYTATLDGSFVCIDCNGAKIYLSFDATAAKEVYNILAGNAARPVKSQQVHKLDTITITCPKCGVKCKYPVGHGEVILTCPKCGCKVRAKV